MSWEIEMLKNIIISGLCGLMLACSSADVAKQVEAAVVPVAGFTGLYESFSCDQLYSEARRVASQMELLAADYNDEVQRSRMEFVGGVVYWPILFFVDSNADEGAAEEYAQLKARLDKLARWMAEKSCRASGSGS